MIKSNTIVVTGGRGRFAQSLKKVKSKYSFIYPSKKALDITLQKKGQKYVPLSKRQDRPNAALWLIKNYPQLSDGQIGKLVGSTKNTISLIKSNNYWNSSNLSAKDPVVSNLCSQNDVRNAVEKAERRIVRKKKEKERENKKAESQPDNI